MSLRTWLVFLLAIASGMSAILGVIQLRQRQVGKETATVVVVKKSVGRGLPIPAENVELRKIPSEFVGPTMVKTLDAVVGKIATSTLFEGEFVLHEKVAKAGSRGGGIATLIPAGLRAYSIQASNSANRVSGLLQAGDHVDVLLTRGSQSNSGDASAKSESLIQNVEVLAIDKNVEQATNKSSSMNSSSKPEAKTSTVTLLVTPKQAAVLGLGQKEGILSLALRNPEDDTITEGTDVSEAELMDQTDIASISRVSHKKTIVDTDETAIEEELEPYADETASELVKDSQDDDEPAITLTIEEMQQLLNENAGAGKSKSRFSAIRTIRGSRVGVIPIHLSKSP